MRELQWRLQMPREVHLALLPHATCPPASSTLSHADLTLLQIVFEQCDRSSSRMFVLSCPGLPKVRHCPAEILLDRQ